MARQDQCSEFAASMTGRAKWHNVTNREARCLPGDCLKGQQRQ